MRDELSTQLRRSSAPSPRSSLRLSTWGRSAQPSPAKKRRTGDGFYLGRAQVHGGMRLCTSSCRTCCPTNDASPCRNVLHNDRRLEAASSYPRTTVRGLVPASLGKPKLFKFEQIGLCVWATGAHGQISGHEGAPAVFGTNLRVAHGEPSSWLVWTDKGPLRMSGTHRPWVACCDALGSAEARTLS